MITILHPDDHARWLEGNYDNVVALQWPYAADAMRASGPVLPTRANA